MLVSILLFCYIRVKCVSFIVFIFVRSVSEHLVILRQYVGNNWHTRGLKVANFRQRRLWVLKSLILPLNCTKLGIFSPMAYFVFLEENFQTAVFRQAKI